MDKKNVYVCGKVGKKKFEVFRGLSGYVDFNDSVRILRDCVYTEYSTDHYDGLPTPDFPFDYAWDSLCDLDHMADMTADRGMGYRGRFNEVVIDKICDSDLVVGYFETSDAYGSLVEIGYALGLEKRVLLVFNLRVVDGNLAKQMLDVYRLLVLMPGVELRFVDPDDAKDRADLFLRIATILGLEDKSIKNPIWVRYRVANVMLVWWNFLCGI